MTTDEHVIGPYKVLRVIGEGGVGIVYEAIDSTSGQRVALKLPTSGVKQKAEAGERFHREARIAAQLTSMHVTKVLGAGATPDGVPYIAMELLEGTDLADALTEVLPIATAVDYVVQAALGLADAHRFGIVHRDIKPANIFVCKVSDAKGRRLVKVLDFGISKVDDGSNITRTFDSFGTPQYMSPEQIRATKDVDARTDLWSLGIVLYEALSGGCPFDGPPTRVIAAVAMDPVPPLPPRADMPEGLEAVVMKALHKDPDKRFQSAFELIEALSPFAPQKPLRIEPVVRKAVEPLVPVLGSLLIQSGVIDAAQLRRALAQQATDRRPLGHILVAQGACTSANIDDALASQKALIARKEKSPGVDPEAPTLEAIFGPDGHLAAPPQAIDPIAPLEPRASAAAPGSVAGGAAAPAGQPAGGAAAPAGRPASEAAAPAGPPAGVEPRPARAAASAAPSPIVSYPKTVSTKERRRWVPLVAALLAGAALAGGAVLLVMPPRPEAKDAGAPPAEASQDAPAPDAGIRAPVLP